MWTPSLALLTPGPKPLHKIIFNTRNKDISYSRIQTEFYFPNELYILFLLV